MNKIISTFTITLIFASISFGQVAGENTQTLEKMFEVSGKDGFYKGSITNMFAAFKKQHADININWDDLERTFLQNSLNEIFEMLSPIYNKYLTKSELEEIIGFYQTPIGRKYGEITPSIMYESMEVDHQWMMKNIPKLQNIIKEKEE